MELFRQLGIPANQGLLAARAGGDDDRRGADLLFEETNVALGLGREVALADDALDRRRPTRQLLEDGFDLGRDLRVGGKGVDGRSGVGGRR